MLTILRGDTTREFVLRINDVPEDAAARISYQNCTRFFPDATQELRWRFTHTETRGMALGAYPMTVRLELPDGTMRTLENAGLKIYVTDDASEANTDTDISLGGGGGGGVAEVFDMECSDWELRRKFALLWKDAGGTVENEDQ